MSTTIDVGDAYGRDVYGGAAWPVPRPAVFPPLRRAMLDPVWLLWLLIAVAVAVGLAGCEPAPPPTLGETCREVCAPFPVRSSGYVVRWALEVAGMQAGDDLADLFPGTGIVAATWKAWLRERTAERLELKPTG